MPVFGNFETVGDPHAETQARDHSTTIWKARKTGSSEEPAFAIKFFSPKFHRIEAGHTAEELEADRGLEFIRILKQQKKASEGKRKVFAPLHEFGTVPGGAWYATDFYPRGSIKTWINLRGHVDVDSLQNVVGSAVLACQLFKQTCGRSHGNLKAANLFLAGKVRPLNTTALQLSDPLPDHAGRGAAETPEALEVQDLRAIGELVLQLVVGRIFESVFDYNYPVNPSKEWQQLGKDGDKWRELCNQLLSPNLSLSAINLDQLARQYPPPAGSSLPWGVISVVVGTCLVGGGLAAYHFHSGGGQVPVPPITQTNVPTNPPTPQVVPDQVIQQKYAAAMKAGNVALAAKEFAEALKQAGVALDNKPGDDLATQLQTAATTGQQAVQAATVKEQAYAKAMSVGQVALAGKDYAEALKQAGLALDNKPGDDAAMQLQTAATAGQQAAATLAQQAAAKEQIYATALKAGQEALAGKDFAEALKQAGLALDNKPGDKAATQLQTAATAGQLAAQTAAEKDRHYAAAISAGQAALAGKDYAEALKQAGLALLDKPGDEVATQLQTAATAGQQAVQTAAEKEQAYATAMSAGQTALTGKDYAEALRQAGLALASKPGDGAATQLQTAATTGQQAAQAAAAKEQAYAAAISAGNAALAGKDYAEALKQAGLALQTKPGDEVATQLQTAATAGQQAVQTAAEKEQSYATAMSVGQAALTATNYLEALKQAGLALASKPGDGPATQLQSAATAGQQAAQAAAAKEQSYTAAISAGNAALVAKDYAEALKQAGLALQTKPGDEVATQLQTAATAAQVAAGKEQNYAAAMSAGQAALTAKEYAEALKQAGLALQNKPGDDPATQLQAAATAGQQAAAAAAVKERAYTAAMSAGQTALAGKDYAEALKQAGLALENKPGDDPATQLQTAATAAQAAAQKEQAYVAAMSAGQAALTATNYAEALKQAGVALDNKPGDDPAVRLQTAATAGQAALAKEQNYAAAMSAGQTALAGKDYAEALKQAGVALDNKPADDPATQLQTAATTGQKIAALTGEAGQAEQAGNYTNALARYQDILDLKPDATEVAAANEKISLLKPKADDQLKQFQERQKLDTQLQDLMNLYGVTSATILTKDDPKKAQPTTVDPGILDSDLKRVDQLRKSYNSNGHQWLDDERKGALDKLAKVIPNWE